MFTDDTGVDTVLGAGGGGAQISGTPANNQIAIWTGATDIEGDVDLTFDGATLAIGSGGGTEVQVRASEAIGFQFRPTATTGGWARGIAVERQSDSTVIGGFGWLGNAETLTFAAIGFGVNWFNADSAFRFYNDGSLLIAEQSAAIADVVAYGQVWVRDDAPNELVFTDDDGNDISLVTDLWNNGTLQAQTTLLGLDVRDTLKVGSLGSTTGNVKLGEQASADADEAGYGQIWVRSDVPNNLMFTDDSGNDFLVAGTGAGADISAGSNLISGTGFVAVANVSPEINTDYFVMASVEVTAPAADDMNIQFTIDTNARFYGTLTNTEDDSTQIIEGQTAEVVTNNVLVPTSGAATPAGTYVTIIGRLIMGATTGTMSLRCAKNADTGADGFAIRGAIKLIPIDPQ